MRKHCRRPLRRIDIAIGNHGDGHCALDRGDRVVFDSAHKRTRTRAPVHRQRLDARILGAARNGDRVSGIGRGAGADLERDGDADGGHDSSKDGADQGLVGEQCRAGRRIAHFLGGAAHVDVDDLRPTLDVVARRVGKHPGFSAGNLHRDGSAFAFVVDAAARFVGVAQPGVGPNHFRDCIARAQLFA